LLLPEFQRHSRGFGFSYRALPIFQPSEGSGTSSSSVVVFYRFFVLILVSPMDLTQLSAFSACLNTSALVHLLFSFQNFVDISHVLLYLLQWFYALWVLSIYNVILVGVQEEAEKKNIYIYICIQFAIFKLEQ
jgi:hypothetical protein